MRFRNLFLLGTALLWPAAQASAQGFTRSGWKTDFTNHTVPLGEIVSGGPPKDGIPAIDDPSFVSAREADRWLDDREPVAVVRLQGETRVYPLQILIWHEIVNDQVGSTPVSVTFCPLCNTTLAFDRRFDGRVMDFGTTGNLRHSDMIMYDRQTETWWQQATGEGVVGRYAGEQLDFIPAPVLSWAEVRDSESGVRVLSRETGFSRNYGQNPYQGYDRRRSPFERFFRKDEDNRMPAMERVVSLGGEEDPVAVPFSALETDPVVHLEAAGEPVVIFWAPGTASALDNQQIAASRAVGSTAVFRPTADGRTLTFEPADDGTFRDRETGSTWTMTGRAVSGPLAGRELEPVVHGNHFWFAWVAFRPGTRVERP